MFYWHECSWRERCERSTGELEVKTETCLYRFSSFYVLWEEREQPNLWLCMNNSKTCHWLEFGSLIHSSCKCHWVLAMGLYISLWGAVLVRDPSDNCEEFVLKKWFLWEPPNHLLFTLGYPRTTCLLKHRSLDPVFRDFAFVLLQWHLEIFLSNTHCQWLWWQLSEVTLWVRSFPVPI